MKGYYCKFDKCVFRIVSEPVVMRLDVTGVDELVVVGKEFETGVARVMPVRFLGKIDEIKAYVE